MNVQELNLVKNRHEETMIALLDIISKHIKSIPQEMIYELEKYNEGLIYEIDACISGQLDESMVTT